MTLTPEAVASTTFADLGVPEFVCNALARRGIERPFEIQAATIADTLAGRDVCGAAPTGSGKTLAFGVPLVSLTERGRPHHPRALVLSPTRELADQIADEMSTLSGRTTVEPVYGGVGYGKQVSALKRGVDILVACPGRLEDLMEQGTVRLSEVERVVIDEADRMADMGFMPAVRRILDATTSRQQTVLFSATLDGDVGRLVEEYQHDPVRHEVTPDEGDTVPAEHLFWMLARDERLGVLSDVLSSTWPAIVFCRTRHGADRLAKQLARNNVIAVPIHGGLSQQQRTRALANFTNGHAHALIATDVAARGIHVDGVACVVHFDVPEDHKAYIHRSGRTARAGRGGVVLSFIEPNGKRAARRMQREVGIEAEITAADPSALSEYQNYSPAPTPAPVHSPAQKGKGGSRNKKPAGRGQQRGGQQRGAASGRGYQERRNDDRRSDDRRSDDRRSDERRGADVRNEERRSNERRDGGQRRDERSGDGASRNGSRDERGSDRNANTRRDSSPTSRGSRPRPNGTRPSGPRRKGAKGQGRTHRGARPQQRT